MSKPVVVFVDDSQDELDLFKLVFQDAYFLVLERNAKSALSALAFGKPNLILLDVYLPVHGRDRKVPKKVAEQELKFPPDQGELREAYNNLVRAQKRFETLQSARAHGLAGGLKLARTFAKEYPGTPLIGYSRKSNPIECLDYLASIPTAVDFVQKPNDPRGWQETCELTARESKRLQKLFDSYIGASSAKNEHLRYAAREILLKIDYFLQN